MTEENTPADHDGHDEDPAEPTAKGTVADLGGRAAEVAGEVQDSVAGAKGTVADLGGQAAGAAGAAAVKGVKDTVAADEAPSVPTPAAKEAELPDGAPPRMPDRPARDSEAPTDQTAPFEPDVGTEEALPTEAAPPTAIPPTAMPPTAMPTGLGALAVETDKTDTTDKTAGNAAKKEAAASVPPVGRYAMDRKHRVAADTRGRTISQKDYNNLSRRSLLTGVVGAAAAFVGWRTIQGRPEDDNIPDVLRDVHQANESIWRGLFRSGAEAPTFDYDESSMMRVNGRHGIRDDLNLASWEMVVIGRNGEELGTHSVDDLRSMEQIELTVEHKCVEGWAHIVTWGGVRFSDFVERFYPEEAAARFVGLATPDNEYRVGLDMDSMLHSQTLLALDLQREPLSEEHGAPVRLATPLKYGIKQIKRIGTIEFSDTQPEDDYWATRGYDWYAGL